MTVEELDSSPSLPRLYAKAAVDVVTPGGGGDGLPDTELVLAGVEIDRDHLAAYDRVCGFTLRDRLPATYPHVIAFPLAVRIMTSDDFPFALPGLVHIANRIELRRPIHTAERLTLHVRATDLRDHPKGRQFDIRSEATVDDETVWTETGTILRSGGGSGGESAPADPHPARPPRTARWRRRADTGRRYAAVSGDRNPIHLHPLTAKAFGFPRQIAHGMWTKARCLAQLDERTPDAYAVEVAFRKPLVLPSTVGFGARRDGDGWRFAVVGERGGSPHLTGTLTAES
jgi:acyl dehydratase